MDVVQPDARRTGGVSERLEVAAVAEVSGLEPASHGGCSTNMNMLLAIPHAIYMETSGPHKGMANGEIPGWRLSIMQATSGACEGTRTRLRREPRGRR